MRKATKKPKQKSQPEGRTRNKKKCAHQKEKEKQNKENIVKNAEEKHPRGRHTPGERIKKRKEEKRRKKGYKKWCLKRKREKSLKNAKKTHKNENMFSKREETFLATKRFQFKIKAEKNFFFLKKGKGSSKEHILKKERAYQKNTFFLFSFF